MPREDHNPDVDHGATPVPVAAGGAHCAGRALDDSAGWDLVHYDWGTRQGEPPRSSGRWVTCVSAMCTRVGRLFLRAPGVVDAEPTLHER